MILKIIFSSITILNLRFLIFYLHLKIHIHVVKLEIKAGKFYYKCIQLLQKNKQKHNIISFLHRSYLFHYCTLFEWLKMFYKSSIPMHKLAFENISYLLLRSTKFNKLPYSYSQINHQWIEGCFYPITPSSHLHSFTKPSAQRASMNHPLQIPTKMEWFTWAVFYPHHSQRASFGVS